ncbi:MAG: cytochrome c biogenesis protein CcsA, partial [Proteobacteria bacterium]|nr:cytochrome c biogenesis protein CcsA [Pseudomonadota bacterium]
MINAIPSAWLVRFHRLGSPPSFYHLSGLIIPWVGAACLILIVAGLYGGLYLAPTDYQQGESYRIIYLHVPSAWMSMFVYVVLATSSAISLIWRMKLAEA